MTAAAVMERYRACALAHDFEGALALVADDAVLHVPGRSAFAGTHRGRDAFTGYLDAVRVAAGETLALEVVDTLASEERVALVVRETLGRADGGAAPITIARANVYRVAGDRIVEITIFEHHQELVDAYLADVPVPAALRAGATPAG